MLCLFLNICGCQLIPCYVTKRQNWDTNQSHITLFLTKSSLCFQRNRVLTPKKTKTKTKTKKTWNFESGGGDQGSCLVPGKCVQSEHLTECALLQWLRGTFMPPRLAWAPKCSLETPLSTRCEPPNSLQMIIAKLSGCKQSMRCNLMLCAIWNYSVLRL